MALCGACGTGQPCAQAVAVEKFHSGQQYAEFEVETAPAECRSIAITDEARVVVEKPVETAWAIKEQLDPANLLKVKQKKRTAPKPKKASAPKRAVTQPKKREPVTMDEQIEQVEQTAQQQPKTWTDEEAKAEVLSMRGEMSVNALAKHVQRSYYVVQKWVKGGKPAKAPGKKPVKPAAAATKPAAAVVSGNITLQAPVASLDRFWQRLTIPDKIRIVERELFGG
jgi:hypothetical protein